MNFFGFLFSEEFGFGTFLRNVEPKSEPRKSKFGIEKPMSFFGLELSFDSSNGFLGMTGNFLRGSSFLGGTFS